MSKEKKSSSTAPQGWYYMSQQEITVSELAKALDESRYDIEVWVDAEVLEIGVEEKVSVDVEDCELDLGDEYSNDFLAQNEVKSLFYVSFPATAGDVCKPVLKEIVVALGGMFCKDTEDFTPVIR